MNNPSPKKSVITLNHNCPELHGAWLHEFTEDAVRIESWAYMSHCTIIDTNATKEAHRDAIQLIPKGKLQKGDTEFYPVIPRAQYAAGLLGQVLIQGNHIRSLGKLQGIFCSDGLLADIEVLNNVIETQGEHFITLSGLVSGCISGNKDASGKPCRVVLKPLRIGGNIGTGGNVYVISFKDSDHDYADLETIVPDDEDRAVAQDLRRVVFNNRDTFLECFDLTTFYEMVEQLPLIEDVSQHCARLKQLALQCGVVVPYPDTIA